MKLHIDGKINRTYCQNLCLIFFPGAKFPENEAADEASPEVTIQTRLEDGYVISEAAIISGGRKEIGRGRTSVSSAVSEDRAFKISVGEAMLEAGERLMGMPPPWGILTGVRPAKIAGEMKNVGLTKRAFRPL